MIDYDKLKIAYSIIGEILSERKEYTHPRQYADTLVTGLCAPSVGTTGCQHESNGYSYVTPNQPQMHSRKCIKCGVFYR
jgi:hypothetical protein